MTSETSQHHTLAIYASCNSELDLTQYSHIHEHMCTPHHHTHAHMCTQTSHTHMHTCVHHNITYACTHVCTPQHHQTFLCQNPDTNPESYRQTTERAPDVSITFWFCVSGQSWQMHNWIIANTGGGPKTGNPISTSPRPHTRMLYIRA